VKAKTLQDLYDESPELRIIAGIAVRSPYVSHKYREVERCIYCDNLVGEKHKDVCTYKLARDYCSESLDENERYGVQPY